MAEKSTKKQPAHPRASGRVKDLKDASQLGRAAESLLNNVTLNKALNEMERNVFEWLTETDLMEAEKREEMYRLMKTIKNFKQVLKVYFNKGSTSQKKLEVITDGGTKRSAGS